MKLRKLLPLLLAALALWGCTEKPLDAAAVAEKMAQAAQAHPLTTVDGELVLDMELEMTGLGMSMALELDSQMEMQMSQEPYAVCIQTDTAYNAMGQNETIHNELYILQEEGKTVAYSYNDSSYLWEKESLEPEKEDLWAQLTALEEAEPGALTLAEKPQTMDGRQVYVLTRDLDPQELIDSNGGLPEAVDLSQEDLMSLTIPAVYYIDCETFLPLRIELTVQGLEEVLNEVLGDIITEDDSTDLDLSMEVFVKELTVALSAFGYDPVEIPELPWQAEFADRDTVLADGSYLLYSGEDAVRVEMPWEYVEYSSRPSQLRLTNIETGSKVHYYIMADMSEVGVRAFMEERVYEYRLDGRYEAHGDGEPIGDFSTMWLEGTDGSRVYYAWKPVGERMLWLYVDDPEGRLDLTTLVEAVTEYDITQDIALAPSQGSYVLTQGDDSVTVAVSDDFILRRNVGNFLGLFSRDGDLRVSYVLEADMDWDALRDQVVTNATAQIQTGSCESYGNGGQIRGFETMYMEMADGSATYYACKQIGDSWLQVEVYDATAWDITHTLSPILKAVSE